MNLSLSTSVFPFREQKRAKFISEHLADSPSNMERVDRHTDVPLLRTGLVMRFSIPSTDNHFDTTRTSL